MVGLRPGLGHFAVFLLAAYVMGSIGVVLGTALGIMLPAVHMVTAAVPPLIMPQLLFSGFMLRPNDIPFYFKWLYYISFFQYSFQVLLIDQFRGFEFAPCDPFKEFCPLGFGSKTGDAWITTVMGYEVKGDAIPLAWSALIGMLVFFFVGGYWIAKWEAARG